MSFADAHAVKRCLFQLCAPYMWLRLRAEVVCEVLPVVAALIIRAERATGIVAAMDHAMFAARIARHTVDDAVFLPLHFTKHLGVTRIVAVGHQVAWRFPTAHVVGRDGPRGAGQFAFAGEKFLINRRSENREVFSPLLNLREFLPRHVAREEE